MTLDSNAFEDATVLNLQTPGPAPATDFALTRNTVDGNGALLRGNFGNARAVRFVVKDNTLGGGTVDGAGTGARAEWSGMKRPAGLRS